MISDSVVIVGIVICVLAMVILPKLRKPPRR